MTHPLIDQLRFTRSEWLRALDGVNDEDARKRLLPMNSISWTIGHLAWQEQRYWLTFGQGQTVVAELNALVGYGRPATTPPLADMLQEAITIRGWITTTYGSLLLRVNYHYWYHIGEIMAIRQQLGHANLPEFVGAIDSEAPYRAE